DPVSGKCVADADRWQTVFTDSAGGHGLLGQVEGRTKADATGWLAAQDPAWRAGVRYVSIDMSSVYKSAATSGLLPNAEVVLDLFMSTSGLCRRGGCRAWLGRCRRRGGRHNPVRVHPVLSA